MDKKIYNLMNWPDIEGIVYSECDAPHNLLGGHVCKEGFLIQVFRPDAVEVSVHVEGRQKSYLMEKVDEAGFYAVLIPEKKKRSYTVTVENIKGHKDTYTDSYAFESLLDEKDINRFLSGNSCDAYRFMGSHEMQVDTISGVNFAVWAPGAVRVSVVGDFNHWDGRLHQMRRVGNSGIFDLFVPNLKAGATYKYEIKTSGSAITLKLDPFALKTTKENNCASVIYNALDYVWKDSSWQKKQHKDSLLEKPMAVCELDIDALNSKGIVAEIQKLGFSYVQLPPICECINDRTGGYETVSYFALTQRLGSVEDFKKRVDEFHKAGIGVIVDWNAAFMANVSVGLTLFDGKKLYESAPEQLDKHPQFSVATFDYAKPQIQAFLTSSLLFWAEQYHIDGVRIDEVASMLYLDYGKKPGEWTTNLYGGNENTAAIEFIQHLHKVIEDKKLQTLLIAEDSSAWPQVTGKPVEGSLGFDYKWNYGWKNDLLSFMEQDPLFRKGAYDKITHSMLYHYSENFMLALSHEEFEGPAGSLIELMPGKSKEDKLENIRTIYGYMYMHPGKKLVNFRELDGVEEFIKALNLFYQKYPALYEQDYETAGFEWLDNSSVEETVLSFVRRASNGQELLVIVSFTPVLRENFQIGVTRAGKYKEILNSDDVKYGGLGNTNLEAICSENEPYNGREHSVKVLLPPSGVVVFSYTPYTGIELEEMKIRAEALKAKQLAEKEARAAQELKRKAEEEAARAVEAEKQAKAAAKEALTAKIKAEKQAEEAARISSRIDAETRKKLEELRAE